jgi:RNA polymerase sigma-70 factor (ECF subfamily)
MQSIESADVSTDPDVRFERSLQPLLAGLRGAALRLTRNRHDAEDLLQEATLRAWRFWAHFESGSNLRAWLHRILLNTFVNGYRRARRERELMHEVQAAAALDARAPFEPALVRMALTEELQASLAELPPEFHAVLWAVAVDDLTYREAADALGCPLGTVMSRLHRARRILQQRLRAGPVERGLRQAA